MRYRLGWRLKAVLPVALVLLAGVAIFGAATLELETSARYRIFAIAAGGALAVCAVLLVMLALVIQRPLVELSRKIEQVSAGNMNARVEFASRGDDIGRLGRHFNDMVQQLQESRDEVRRMYQTRMSRAEHLATLGELAAGLAHEIRNPLAGIVGAVEILGRELPPSNPSQAIVGEVQQEVRRIQGTLSELLSYARPRPAEMRPADLNISVEQAVVLVRQQVTSRPIEIRFTPASLPAVVHDPGQIEQVILNLLLNAIQAIDRAGVVAVEVKAGDAFATISVRDSGRGIAPEHLDRIFRPFFTTKTQGTGLGLSLTRRIIDQHGGRIDVRSKAGEGTEFIIQLPLAGAELEVTGTDRQTWQKSNS
ncbi:MAG TPA: ATP-binding protein [Candidatus Acidoferrales bacterium]|nr:ATP-binding protein [Candidatus Acidoferrales bacterium]